MFPTITGNTLLIAPLCWGLGHATRCIPLIRHYQAQGKTVLLASDSEALVLLQKEFPELQTFELPSYNIRYNSSNMALNMLLQLPHIILAIGREFWALRKIIQKHAVQAIISDNRYGCFGAHTDIFVSHQINIKVRTTTEQSSYWEAAISLLHRTWMNTFFHETWIPDLEIYDNSLAGALSHGKLPQKHRFIGVLTRFSTIEAVLMQRERPKVSVVLSGPEPQRSYLEQKILAQAALLPDYDFVVVCGKTHLSASTQSSHITLIPMLTADNLFALLQQSDYIVTRAGYSTLMDLSVLSAKVLLIPTPGQTEQEYLAHRFCNQPNYITQTQSDLDLSAALKFL